VASGIWTEIDIGGHTADVYEPQTLHPQGFVVLYLHGLHGNRLVNQAAFCTEFDRHGLRAICPRTARSWWTDKICPEFDPHITAERYVLDQVLAEIDRRWSIQPPGIGLLGTSMGGQGALRFAFKHPRKFPVTAALAPAIDYYLRMDEGDDGLAAMYSDAEAARQDSATLHVHPLNWPHSTWFCCDPVDERWHTSADRLRMKLAALGIPFQCDLETTGGGHGFEYYGRMAPRAMEFLVERLEQESRRV
jgi:S-formylglutathione hydrolase FrmB